MLVPQRVYVGGNASFQKSDAVIFPEGLNLRHAAEQRFASDIVYQDRPEISSPDRGWLSLKIEVSASMMLPFDVA